MEMNKWNLQLFAEAGTVVNTTAGYANAYDGSQEGFDGTNNLSPEMLNSAIQFALDDAKKNTFNNINRLIIDCYICCSYSQIVLFF